ncbi:MAG: serine hydrolase, partial [Alphaproteobacteria bacterium]|nr:serine hydrolase [Alphaproteobacteria bacterium]
NAWLKQHGIQGMRVDRNIAQLLAARRNLWEQEDSSTPRAMLTFLSKLDRGELTSTTSRNIIIDMMRRCETGRNRIKGLINDGTIIEHKTGTLRNYTSDVGFMTLPDGKRIIVAFFARGGVNRPAVIATAARAIRDGYDSSAAQSSQIAGWNPNYAYYEAQGATEQRPAPTGNLVAIRPRNSDPAESAKAPESVEE